jgi:hypothetical protein
VAADAAGGALVHENLQQLAVRALGIETPAWGLQALYHRRYGDDQKIAIMPPRR